MDNSMNDIAQKFAWKQGIDIIDQLYISKFKSDH